MKKNPWRGKADVARHNKECAQKAACRKEWLRVANDIYKKRGEAGAAQAVISANSYVKRHRLKNPHEEDHVEGENELELVRDISNLWRLDWELDKITQELALHISPADLLDVIQQWRLIYGSDLFPFRLRHQ